MSKLRPPTLFLIGALIGTFFCLLVRWTRGHERLESGNTILSPQMSDGIAIRQLRFHEELLRRFHLYRNKPSRHNLVILEEVIASYMRADAGECLALLQSLNLSSIISSASWLAPGLQSGDLDFEHLLKIASQADPQTAHDLIISSYRSLIATNPKTAYEYLKYLPSYLKAELGAELARSWGKRDGAIAMQTLRADLPESKALYYHAFVAWGSIEPVGAFEELAASERSGRNRDFFLTQMLAKLENTEGGFQLLVSHPEMSGTCARLILARMAAQRDASSALKTVNEFLVPKLQMNAYSVIAKQNIERDPTAAIQVGCQLPISYDSLALITQAAVNLGKNSQNPFAAAEQQRDPYQRAAIVNGITKGIYESKGRDGIIAAVKYAESSNNLEWLDAVGSLILSVDAPAGLDNNTSVKQNSLPKDVVAALQKYADAKWSPHKAVSLSSKLR